MDTNRKLRSELNENVDCKSEQPTNQLERLNALLIEVPTAFSKDVQRLNLNMLREIQNAARELYTTQYRQLHNDLVVIDQFSIMLRNGIVNRDEYLEAITPLQPVIEAAAKRERLLSSITDEMSGWTLEQLEAFENLCKTLHRA